MIAEAMAADLKWFGTKPGKPETLLNQGHPKSRLKMRSKSSPGLSVQNINDLWLAVQRHFLLFIIILLTACNFGPQILVQTEMPALGTAYPAKAPPLISSPRGTATHIVTPTATLIPTPTTSPIDIRKTLQAQTDAVLNNFPADWHILVKQVGSDVLYSRQVSQKIDVASVIKFPIALLFFKSLEKKNLPTLKDYLAQKGIDRRTFEQLLRAMLVNSEEDATLSLMTTVANSHLDVDATLQDWGATHTNIYLRKSTLEDVAALIDGFYAHDLIAPEARDILLTYRAENTEADDTRIGIIRTALPCGAQFYNKRGTITKEYLVGVCVKISGKPHFQTSARR